jgi:hypothetical protein
METDNFRHHITTTSIARMDQIRLIQEAFAAACLAKSEIARQRIYIQDTMKKFMASTLWPTKLISIFRNCQRRTTTSSNQPSRARPNNLLPSIETLPRSFVGDAVQKTITSTTTPASRESPAPKATIPKSKNELPSSVRISTVSLNVDAQLRILHEKLPLPISKASFPLS